ncbi:MAG: hypothetical protein WC099_01145 [Candidatus Paceibacterota bacterium]
MRHIHRILHTSLTALIVICGIVGSYGLQTPTVYAETKDTTSSQLTEIKDQIRQLFELQDSITIPQQDKDLQELQLRRKILTAIVTATQKQTATARDEFEKIQLPNSDDWKQIHDSILSSFDATQEYYTEVYNRITNDPNLTSSLLKNIARDIEQKKTQEIDPLIKKAHVIVATFNITDMLKVGDDRLAKIKLDVDKIYTQKLTRSQTLKQLFEKASLELSQAREFNDLSKETILYAYTTPETGSSTEYLDALYKKLEKEKGDSLRTTHSSTDSSSEVIQDYIQKTVTESITSIKSVYDIFMKMSSNVKSYLK